MSQNRLSITFYLHDAVYLYLRTVNQTLADGYTDYKDGRFMRNRTIGQRFTGEFLTPVDLFVDAKCNWLRQGKKGFLGVSNRVTSQLICAEPRILYG